MHLLPASKGLGNRKAERYPSDALSLSPFFANLKKGKCSLSLSVLFVVQTWFNASFSLSLTINALWWHEKGANKKHLCAVSKLDLRNTMPPLFFSFSIVADKCTLGILFFIIPKPSFLCPYPCRCKQTVMKHSFFCSPLFGMARCFPHRWIRPYASGLKSGLLWAGLMCSSL